jgi:uncharacterized protein (UPF0261 family)
MDGAIYVIGTFDTKSRELMHLAASVQDLGWRAITVDVGTSFADVPADIGATSVAACHPGGLAAVNTGDRGTAVAAMGLALEVFLAGRSDIAGAIAMGGSGGTALVAPALRHLPIGMPKIIVSTVASGNTAPYIDASDLILMPSITDVAGLNRISRRVIANAAAAITAMATANSNQQADRVEGKPTLGLTMFGVTTPCVDRISRALDAKYDCLVFHATGTGGRTMEKLVDAGLVDGVIDCTLTEIADLIAGGVMAATEDRLGAIARTAIPYVGSVGACDMVNFGAPATIPSRYSDRLFYEHNPQVTLMRTTAEENRAMGAFIAAKLNACPGEVRLFLPEGGVSAIDAPEMPFHDPEATAALFSAIEAAWIPTGKHRLIRIPHHINDPAFADAMTAAFEEAIDATIRP